MTGRPLRISQDIVPVSDFKARAASWFRKIAATGAPIVITRNGRPAAVLLSPQAYDQLTERARLVAAVEVGLADVEAGRVHSHADVVSKMKGRFRQRRAKV